MSLSQNVEKRQKKIAKQLSSLKLSVEERIEMAKEIDQFARLLIEIYQQENANQ